MSEMYTPDPLAEALAAQVLESGRQIRAGQERIRREAAENARLALEHEGSYEAQLAAEADSLIRRMDWLARHPRFARMFRLSNLGVIEQGNTVETQALTDGVIVNLSGEHLLFSGLVCRTKQNRHEEYVIEHGKSHIVSARKNLEIVQRVKDEATQSTGERELYSLQSYQTPQGVKIKAWGSEFIAWGVSERKRILKQYEVDHPETKEYHFSHRSKHLLSMQKAEIAPMVIEKPSPQDFFVALTQIGAEKRHQEHYNTVRNLLNPETGFRYPDEMYMMPLTIVKQINLLLGTKTDKK